MTMSRRQFARVLGAAGTLPLNAARGSEEYFVYVGSYSGPKSKGINVWRFNTKTGKVVAEDIAAETQNPSFLAIHPAKPFVVAANEIGQGTVSSFARDPKTGKLTALNTVSSKGSGPCYVSFDGTGKFVLVANYSSGSVAVLPLGADGHLAEASSFDQHHGSGGDPQRQKQAHAHCIMPSPDGKSVLAADLGTDQIMVYKFDSGKGVLTPNEPPSFKLKPGAGPRHFTFHPNNRVAYIINELDSTITAANWDAKAGTLTAFQNVPTLPEDFHGENTTAEIAIHPNGKFLFGSNRGHDSIAVFAVDAKGQLSPRGHVPTGGHEPRNFALDPTGRFLLAANQKSDNVQVFRLDPASGKLTQTGESFEIGAPVCVRFAPVG